MREIPKALYFYRHFKGNIYKVLALAKHTETGETFVIYQRFSWPESEIYARPLDMFMSEVDKTKYPGVTQKYRFERIVLSEVKE